MALTAAQQVAIEAAEILTLDEVAALTKVARCPCCKQPIAKPTAAAQAIIRAALESPPQDDEPTGVDDNDDA